MMRYLTWKMRGLSAAFAVIGTVGFISTAEAIISKKVWDPKYSDVAGTGLLNLGWSGEVAFDIKDDCLNTIGSSQWITNLTTGCVGKLSIESAAVTLYDWTNPTNKVLLSYDDSWNIFAGGNAQATWRMYVEYVSPTEKILKAVQGAFLFPEFTSASFAKVATYDAAAYWLNFNANTTNNFSLTTPDAPDGDYAFLTSCSYKKGSSPGSSETFGHYESSHPDVACSQNDGVGHAAILRPIPEPEAYLLGLASFGVLGVWARRRRPKAR